jgi:DNA replication protein DnaC
MSEMMIYRIRENLLSLKMKHTLEILDNYLERAVKDNLNVVEVLDHILTEESRQKHKRAIEAQIYTYGFPMRKELKRFDFDFQPSRDKCQIDELATMRFLENYENIVFIGSLGVGKTHLATALGLAAAQHRRSTYYINCHALIEATGIACPINSELSASTSCS